MHKLSFAKMDENFGEVEFILTVHGALFLLICESRAVPGHFNLFKKKRKTTAAGIETLLAGQSFPILVYLQ